MDKCAGDAGLKILPKMDSANNQAIVTALYAALGIGFLPESYVEGHVRRGKFKKIEVEGLNSAQKNHLVMHKNKKLNALQQQAYDLVKTIAMKGVKEDRV